MKTALKFAALFAVVYLSACVMNWQTCKGVIQSTERTDADIELCLYYFGYNMDWSDKLTVREFLAAPYRSMNR
jgi:hypothetical protein